MRVAVVGAGAAGLCVAKHALAVLGNNLDALVLFEQTNEVGGTWVYTDNTGTDKYGLPIHSSMYRDMRTNLPKEVMSFQDFPFDLPKNQSFVPHSSVLQYLKDYSKYFNIDKFIRFKERVVSVKKTLQNDFQIISESVEEKQQRTEAYDVVFVCNGHYFEPAIPDILGLSKFKGNILHSHHYRTPDSFKGKRVACLGAGPSGTDIAMELARVCPYVYLCHNKPPLDTVLPENVVQKCGFKNFYENGVQLLDGTNLNLDAVVFCTGYHYDFPFLDSPALPLNVCERRITPLYYHVVHIENPTSLFFIGLNMTILPFPNFDCQVLFALSIVSGRHKVPSKPQMYDWETEDFRRRTQELGFRTKYAHYLGAMQWDYYRELAKMANFVSPVSVRTEQMYEAVRVERYKDLANYKNVNYELVGADGFRRVS